MITLEELEKLRRKVKQLLIITIAIVIVGLFFPIPLRIIFLVAGGVFYLFAVRNKIAEYKKLFKSNIVRASLEGIFTELNYEPSQGVSEDEVRDSKLVEMKDQFSSNDLIVAKYGKVKFKQADILISERSNAVRESGVSREIIKTCFAGRFFVFDFLKPTEVPVKVMGKNFKPEGDTEGVIQILKNKLTGFEKEHQVFMESEVFNSNFSTFCEDAQTAFYILIPQIIDAITMLSNKYEDKIAICFKNKKMFVAIGSKRDSLEAKILSKRTIWEEKELVLEDIKVITDFIELMNLENNTLVAITE